MNATEEKDHDTLVDIKHRDPEEREAVPDTIELDAGETLVHAGETITALYSLREGHVMLSSGKGRFATASDYPQSAEFYAVPKHGNVPGNHPIMGVHGYFTREASPWTYTAMQPCTFKLIGSDILAATYEARKLPGMLEQMLRDSDYSFALINKMVEKLEMPGWSGMSYVEFREMFDDLLQRDHRLAARYEFKLMELFRELVDQRNKGVRLEEQSIVTDVEALHFNRHRVPGR
jgi:CRP-like cAMP-binding protein